MTDATLSTVRNAARLLKAFLPREEELGVSELSRRLGLGKSSVHRLLSTLVGEGLVARDPDTGQYRLGIVMFELGEAVRARMELSSAIGPALAALRDRTGEATQVGILDADDVVYLERLDGVQTPRLFGDQDRRVPMYCTATGKVLLAFRPEPELLDYLAEVPLRRLTRHTITDHARLRGELRTVRRRGWAESVNEREIGVAGLAAPVRDATGTVVAAIGVSAPLSRFRGLSRRQLAQAVAETGAVVSRRLGWPGGELSNKGERN
jgi:DNA-binding IclR family transcriptional regulator